MSLYTKNNVDYLRVSDNGVGMNQHIIDNYYTNVGCSYYSSREFSELMVSFKSSFTPISRFGIGILSCFMVCNSMEVTTRRIRERFECDEALHISIEGYESLFVISDSDKKEPGTDNSESFCLSKQASIEFCNKAEIERRANESNQYM
ncbi:ATP-binding protein [Blautia massiliensis (ex Durand et al. 2017)]|uniref:ATP-binding protein n=1 Tax=Blautia massiliensis (ex Durand et al. 2017) TaxID=1737424 RepID=UPI003B503EFB